MTTQVKKPPLLFSTGFMFAATALISLIVVPWYGFAYGFSATAWGIFALFWLLNGLSITAGYHRLWAHSTYKAHPVLRWFLAIWGAQALQNSILVWSAQHRHHHKYVDQDDKDPYSAGKGLWYSHIGWMLRDYPSAETDFKNVPDLKRDAIVMWQHRWYWPLTAFMNIGLPMLMGWLVGEFWSVVLLAGVLRLFIAHHLTFLINSLAHFWGKQTYTEKNSARDNWVLALLTWGEGYHNFHHMFQNDYRNGIRWWQFDLTKWFINVCRFTGLASGLRRVPKFRILRARLSMDFVRAERKLQNSPLGQKWKTLIEKEYLQFKNTIHEWQELQAGRANEVGEKLINRWQKTAFHTHAKELEYRLKMQRRRIALLSITLGK